MKKVYIVDGARTPFLKAKGKLGPFTSGDLAVGCARPLLARQQFAATAFDEVIVGAAMPSADEANIGRVVSMRIGCGDKVPAWTVMRNCASGLQALDSAYMNVLAGKSHLVLAGGTDAMSHAPLLFSAAMVNWLADWMSAKSLSKRAFVALKFRPHYLAPVIAILKGLTDPIVKLSMGQTAEIVAARFGITRVMMDQFAADSHRKVLQGKAAGHFSEIVPLIDAKGNIYQDDDGVRTDSTPDRLAKLRPFFDKVYGNVTAGNSSQITDGAAMLILASEEAVAKYGLSPLGAIIDSQWSGLDPAEMGLGPVHAITPMLLRNNLGLHDLDALEINEAFAAQALGCLAAWQSIPYCKNMLGLDDADVTKLGALDTTKLNVDGGAIAIGHPIGASGARVVLHALKTLQRTNGRYGAASLCIGGGQGGAMLLERA